MRQRRGDAGNDACGEVESAMPEGQSCDAIITLLERRANHDRADVIRPESGDSNPPVELLFTLGDQQYAIEHTLIEAFEGQIAMGEQFGVLIDGVVSELSGTLPKPGIYYLNFPINTRLGIGVAQIAEARRKLVAWILQSARYLYDNHPKRPTRNEKPFGHFERCREVPPGFPYEVTLERKVSWTDTVRHEGGLLAGRYALDEKEQEESRRKRIKKALQRKCPKLRRCKDQGAKTILVLEDIDFILSNNVVVGEAFAANMDIHQDLPDEIYLVETGIEPWSVWEMKLGDQIWPEVAMVPYEFDSADLVDITHLPSNQ